MSGPQSSAPKVTVILIFLDGEKFLAEAIDSILAQTLDDWELILVDDGSGAAATRIAQDYAKRFAGRIHYTEHPGHANRGMSASRNAGLRLASGRYVAFLDADDTWLTSRLEVHADLLDQHAEVEMIIGPTIWWQSWRQVEVDVRAPWRLADVPSPDGLPLHQVIEPPELAVNFLERRGGTIPGICSVTVRREAVLDVGGFNDDFRTLYEDQVFHFRMGLRHRVWVTDELLSRYRQHPDSACNREGRKASDLKMRPRFLVWLQDHLIEIGCKDPRMWRALRGEMLRFDEPRFWWWSRLPVRARDWWNVESRRLWIFMLTPRGYNRLRRSLGMTYVDPESVR